MSEELKPCPFCECAGNLPHQQHKETCFYYLLDYASRKELRCPPQLLRKAWNIRSGEDALKAELQQAREGISDLWRDCDKLPHAAYCDPTGFGYCTCYRSGFNAMLHNLHSAIVGNIPPEQEGK